MGNLPPLSSSIKGRLARSLGIGLLTIACGTIAARADVVRFNDNPGNAAYDDIRNSIYDVFGVTQASSATGVGSLENLGGVMSVPGTGTRTVPVTFLYDDGDYQFEFGYFEYTSALKSMGSDTVAQKQALAKAALATATVVFRDENRTTGAGTRVTRDADDLYTTAVNDRTRDQANYASANTRTMSLTGGRDYVFFIIPNNTLSAFNADAATDTNGDGSFFESFALDGDSTTAWPLFTWTAFNPGSGTGGSGEGYDQVFAFTGTTRTAFTPMRNNGVTVATLVSFEDISLRRGDNDFNDLHFVIGNASVVTIPETSGTTAGALALGFLAIEAAWGRRRTREQRA